MSGRDRERVFVNDDAARLGEIHCDCLGCDESHPINHDCLGEPCFGTGRWLGWIYIDLNRPDLFPRELRFCGVRCLQWWLDRQVMTFGRQPRTRLDDALSAPHDEVKRRAALKEIARSTAKEKAS